MSVPGPHTQHSGSLAEHGAEVLQIAHPEESEHEALMQDPCAGFTSSVPSGGYTVPIPAVQPSAAPAPTVAPASIAPPLATPSTPAGLVANGSRVNALYALANSLQGTPYSQALRNDCSGMVAQLAAVAVGLPAPPAGQRFNTTNEQDWLTTHGV
jgi:hypothetical protein